MNVQVPSYATDPAFDELCKFIQTADSETAYRQFRKFIQPQTAQDLIASFPERSESEMTHIGLWLAAVKAFTSDELKIPPENIDLLAEVEKAYESNLLKTQTPDHVSPLSAAISAAKGFKQSARSVIAS